MPVLQGKAKMSEYEDMPVGDKRERPLKETEYTIDSVGTGKIICSKPGVKLADFYRSHLSLKQTLESQENIKNGQG